MKNLTRTLIEIFIFFLLILMIVLAQKHDLQAKQEALDECNAYIAELVSITPPYNQPKEYYYVNIDELINWSNTTK